MRKYVFIGCGSFLGAVLRVLIRSAQIPGYHGRLPLTTLFINVSGAFLITFLFTAAAEVWDFGPDIRLGLTTGFLGAFTTFSTFCREVVGLLQDGYYISAMLYMVMSLLFGLGAAYFGFSLAHAAGTKLALRKMENDEESDVI